MNRAEATTIRERAGKYVAAGLLGVALLGVVHATRKGSEPSNITHFEIPQFRDECLVSTANIPEYYSWEDLAGGHVSPEELATFNGSSVESDVHDQDYVDVCPGDGRKHSYVVFSGEMDAKIKPIQEAWDLDQENKKTVVGKIFSGKKSVAKAKVKPEPTPINVKSDELVVREKEKDSTRACRENSIFKLQKRVTIDVPAFVTKETYSTATLIDGNVFATSAHGVAVARGKGKNWSVLNEDGSLDAELVLRSSDGSAYPVTGGIIDFDGNDIAVLFADYFADACLSVGSAEDLSHLDPIRLTNFGYGGEELRSFLARYVGNNPVIESEYYFIDGIDGTIDYDSSDRKETFEPGGSGGSVTDSVSPVFIGVSTNIFSRGNRLNHEAMSAMYGVDSNAFSEFATFRPADSVVSVIKDYYPLLPEDSASEAIYVLPHHSHGGVGPYVIARPQRMFSGHEAVRESKP